MFIYVRVGMVVFAWRKQLLSLSRSEQRASNAYPMKEFPASPMSPTSLMSPPPTQKTYEVTISSQVPHSPDRKARHLSSPRSTYYGDSSPTEPHHQRFQSIHETAFPETNTNVVVEKPQIRTLDANKATLSYCKTAMLFFIALLCTWYALSRNPPDDKHKLTQNCRVPSTVNRVYTLVRPNDSLFGLDFASGLVLPLQGFWNTIIYIVTSLPACKALWADIVTACSARAPRPDRTTPALTLATKHNHNNHRVLGSDDTRADIHVSMDGKNRVVSYRTQDDEDDDHHQRDQDQHHHVDDDEAALGLSPGPGPAFTHAR
jgi:hypothetical protein